MTNDIESWPRPFLADGGYSPRVNFIVYGEFDVEFPEISMEEYRTIGVPEGVQVNFYHEESLVEIMQFLDSPLGVYLKENSPSACESASNAISACAFRGDIVNANNLDYLRDLIGLITCRSDHDGYAILDLNALKMWETSEWRQSVFSSFKATPTPFVSVLSSPDEAGALWLQTRGMLTFGRPDISLKNVSDDWSEAAIELVNRLIRLQAFGGVVKNTQPITMQGLPDGFVCHLQEDKPEDPAFNNSCIEILRRNPPA